METIHTPKEDRQLLAILHFSQLLNFISGVGGFVAPLIIWLLKKDEIAHMDEQGKQVLNFQISFFIYAIIGAILSLILVGFLLLGIIALLNLIFPIINGIKASNGEPTHYPLTINFIK
ncbi:DUF4870 domain-containing protein [Mesonia sp. K7]|uniref:DUF4870 domain-containing protein n=1 Tax=Mesonia sp. K7 TaxID=2218606 RepID=UPI000DA76A73|nr:DUF4870 domain-containing protein [Mesonia sp. K7]PZD76773.1 DUF4870 domain-containing protein [Mesonia sp. K7]